MGNKTLYHIEVTEYMSDNSGETSSHMVNLETDNIEWTMEQYSRNRHLKGWRIISEI
jgi:hypothetical protein